MTIQLHRDIATIAQSDPAIHISERILVNLITNRLDRALTTFLGFYQKHPEPNPIVQIGLKSCSYNRPNANWSIILPPAGTDPGSFIVRSSVHFTATFCVAKINDVNTELFTVTLSVREVNARGNFKGGKLTIDAPMLANDTQLDEDPNYQAHLAACGLTDAKVKRLEGLVEDSIAPAALDNIFKGAPEIDLHALFPMITFQEFPELDQVSGGLLIIARQGARLNPDASCPCGVQAPQIGVTPGASTRPGSGTPGTLPINITIPPPAAQVTENTVNGKISLYIPKPIIASMSGGPYPAVTGYSDDNGFIGYTLDYTVAFLSTDISLSDPRATLVIRVYFYITAHGDVSVDVPCVGRKIVGRCWATNRNNPNISYFEIGVSPDFSIDGKLTFKQQLLHVFVALIDVDVVTVIPALLGYFSPWLGIWGYFVDLVIAREMEMQLPFKLQDAVRKRMGEYSWTVFNVGEFDLNIADDGNYYIQPAVSRTSDSVLVGFDLSRG